MHRYVPALLLFTAYLLCPSIALAQAPAVHELHLVSGVESIPLELVDRGLAPPSGPYQLTVLTPPVHGVLVGEDYSPAPDFWSVGVDHLTLEIAPLAGASSRHTFILAPAAAGAVINSFDEDFDLMTEISAWTSSGDAAVLSFVDPGIDGSSLRAYMHSPQAAGDLGRGLTDLSEGVHALGAAGTTIPEPPDNSQTDPATPGWVNFATAGPNDSSVAIYLQLRLHGDVYSMRASTQPDGSVPCSSCATPWRVVPGGQPIGFRLWSGPTVISPGSGRAPKLRLELDLPGTADDSADWLDGSFDISYVRYGFQQSSGLQNIGTLYDDLRSWKEALGFAPQTLVFDDFEDGGASSWTFDGPVQIDGASAIQGTGGAGVDVAALRAGTPRDALLVDLAPSPQSPAREIGVQMTVDLSTLQLENGESVRVFCGSGTEVTELGLHLSIIVYHQQGSYRIWARARDNSAVQHKSPTYELTTLTPRLSLRWHSAPAAEGGGSVSLWVDGVFTGESPSFGNELKLLDSLAFGAFKPTLGPVGASPEMTIQLDDLVVLAR